jgi:hypothetical protein
MKILKIFLLTLAVSVSSLANIANAQVIDNGTYTTINGFDWLDWSFTADLTEQEAIDKFDKAGYGNSYRLATHDEAIAMLETLYIDITNGEELQWNGEDHINNSASDYSVSYTLGFEELFGTSNSPSGGLYTSTRSYGYIDGGAYGVYEEHWIFGGGETFNSEEGGIVLVRVPAPSTFLLFALLIAGIVIRHYKTSAKLFD